MEDLKLLSKLKDAVSSERRLCKSARGVNYSSTVIKLTRRVFSETSFNMTQIQKVTGLSYEYLRKHFRSLKQESEFREVKIRGIIEAYKERENVLLPALADINDKYGYLPEEMIKYISQELNYPLSMTYRLATFYNAFSLVPKGESIIKVCMGTACYVKGGKKICEEFEEKLNIKLGETTDDLKFSLEAVNCVGCCGQSPVVIVKDDIYGYIKRAEVAEVVKKYKS